MEKKLKKKNLNILHSTELLATHYTQPLENFSYCVCIKDCEIYIAKKERATDV